MAVNRARLMVKIGSEYLDMSHSHTTDIKDVILLWKETEERLLAKYKDADRIMVEEYQEYDERHIIAHIFRYETDSEMSERILKEEAREKKAKEKSDARKAKIKQKKQEDAVKREEMERKLLEELKRKYE